MRDELEVFHPKGTMCAACTFLTRGCNHLAFNQMPVLETYKDGNKIHHKVKCTEFKTRRKYA